MLTKNLFHYFGTNTNGMAQQTHFYHRGKVENEAVNPFFLRTETVAMKSGRHNDLQNPLALSARRIGPVRLDKHEFCNRKMKYWKTLPKKSNKERETCQMNWRC